MLFACGWKVFVFMLECLCIWRACTLRVKLHIRFLCNLKHFQAVPNVHLVAKSESSLSGSEGQKGFLVDSFDFLAVIFISMINICRYSHALQSRATETIKRSKLEPSGSRLTVGHFQKNFLRATCAVVQGIGFLWNIKIKS